MTSKATRLEKRRTRSANRPVRLQDDAWVSQILEAFEDDLGDDDKVDLDQLFSDVLGQGLLSERQIDEGFGRFLSRKVEKGSRNPELAPRVTRSIGDCVKAWRTAQHRTPAAAAARFALSPRQYALLERWQEPSELADLRQATRRLSQHIEESDLRKCLIVLRAILVLANMGRAAGPFLAAARRVRR